MLGCVKEPAHVTFHVLATANFRYGHTTSPNSQLPLRTFFVQSLTFSPNRLDTPRPKFDSHFLVLLQRS